MRIILRATATRTSVWCGLPSCRRNNPLAQAIFADLGSVPFGLAKSPSGPYLEALLRKPSRGDADVFALAKAAAPVSASADDPPRRLNRRRNEWRYLILPCASCSK